MLAQRALPGPLLVLNDDRGTLRHLELGNHVFD
jgi:hypothetical protein